LSPIGTKNKALYKITLYFAILGSINPETDMFIHDVLFQNDQCALMPSTADKLMNEFDVLPNWKKKEMRESFRRLGLEGLSSPHHQYAKYGFVSMKLGRPTDSLMIVTVGPAGVGKSTTINKLFDDQHQYPTTYVVTEYSKFLHIRSIPYPVEGYLKMIKISTTNHVEYDQELEFSQSVDTFRENHLAKPNHDVSQFAAGYKFTIATQIYPNIVLFIFDASDKRMDGPNSQIRQNLRLAHQYDLIDKLNNNLILVGTRCCSIASNKDAFKETLDRIRTRLQTLVEEELGISEFKIVFIENSPENYELENNSGYVTLPDGEMSHLNLIKAIGALLKSNKDCFGELLAKYYFMPNVPEKNDKASISGTQNLHKNNRNKTKLGRCIYWFNKLVRCQFGCCFPLESNALIAGNCCCCCLGT
jgi:GTPase SAR1 family protein